MIDRNNNYFISQEEEALDENALIVEAKKKDQTAFGKLYRLYNERINRYITRMVGNPNIGCELTQETFLKAWENLPTLRGPDCFAPWLYRIATNKTYNHIHRERQIHMVPWGENTIGTSALSYSDLENRVEDGELIWLVLARMRPTYRACLILYAIEELPRQRVADMLGVKISSIDKYISRSKEAFRRAYYQVADNN